MPSVRHPEQADDQSDSEPGPPKSPIDEESNLRYDEGGKEKILVKGYDGEKLIQKTTKSFNE